MKISALFFSLFLGIVPLLAQETSAPIIFIYDASGSMWGQHESSTKMQIASKVLGTTVENLPEGQKMGLVAYGHRRKGDCKDVEYMVSSDNDKSEAIKTALKGIKPLGRTPLAYSASLVIDQLKEKKEKATIILITDGIESCDGDLCQVVRDAKAAGIEFKLHIIGFGLKEGETEALKCAANEGEGNYYDASDTDALSESLEQATSIKLEVNEPNFTAYAVKNGQPVDALFRIYDVKAKRKPILARTYQDTGKAFLPPSTYNLEVTALEGSDVEPILVDGIIITEGKTTHQTVSFDGGKIKLSVFNNEEGWDATFKVFETASDKVVAYGRTYGRTKEVEVSPGNYYITIQALNLKGMITKHKMDDVTVSGNGVQDLSHNFESGIFMFGCQQAGEFVDAMVTIKDVQTGTTIDGKRTSAGPNNNPRKFLLNPGNYKVTYTTLGKHKGKSDSFEITVTKGETVEKLIKY